MLLVSTVWLLFSDGNSVSGTAMPDVVQTNVVESEEFEVILTQSSHFVGGNSVASHQACGYKPR